jgi:hypothetical protein
MNIQLSKRPKGNDPRKGVYFGVKQTKKGKIHLIHPTEDIPKKTSTKGEEIHRYVKRKTPEDTRRKEAARRLGKGPGRPA